MLKTFWTDITYVLKYIKNEDNCFHTFEATRVSIIKEATRTFWGMQVKYFIQKNSWIEGPTFFKETRGRLAVLPLVEASIGEGGHSECCKCEKFTWSKENYVFQQVTLFEPRDLNIKRWWRQTQYIANLFWKQWVWEYLPLMQERQKWKQRRNHITGYIMVERTVLSTWVQGSRSLTAIGIWHVWEEKVW